MATMRRNGVDVPSGQSQCLFVAATHAAWSTTAFPSVLEVRGARTSMPPPPSRASSARAVAASLGVAGPLGEQPRDEWKSSPSSRERHAILALRASADFRMDTASGSKAGPSHLVTAPGWLRRFVETVPSRRLFVPHTAAGDIHAAAYNEETILLRGEFIRRNGSVRPGRSDEVLSATTIVDYVSAIRAFRSREAGYNLLVSGGNLRLPRQIQQMRREDGGPKEQRGLARGMTSRFLRRLCSTPACESMTGRGKLRWAVLWVGHNLLLQDGGLGRPDIKESTPLWA